MTMTGERPLFIPLKRLFFEAFEGGRISQLTISTAASKTKAWEACYGPGECQVACIHIEVL